MFKKFQIVLLSLVFCLIALNHAEPNDPPDTNPPIPVKCPACQAEPACGDCSVSGCIKKECESHDHCSVDGCDLTPPCTVTCTVSGCTKKSCETHYHCSAMACDKTPPCDNCLCGNAKICELGHEVCGCGDSRECQSGHEFCDACAGYMCDGSDHGECLFCDDGSKACEIGHGVCDGCYGYECDTSVNHSICDVCLFRLCNGDDHTSICSVYGCDKKACDTAHTHSKCGCDNCDNEIGDTVTHCNSCENYYNNSGYCHGSNCEGCCTCCWCCGAQDDDGCCAGCAPADDGTFLKANGEQGCGNCAEMHPCHCPGCTEQLRNWPGDGGQEDCPTCSAIGCKLDKDACAKHCGHPGCQE